MGNSYAASNAALRGRKVVVLLVSVAALVGPFATGGHALDDRVPPCSIPGQIEPHIPPEVLRQLQEGLPPEALAQIPYWYSVKNPPFPAGSQGVTDYTVEPLATERMYVTNGTVVMRSTDSGCHWSQAYALPAGGQGMTAANSRILEIEVSAPGHIYLPIQQTAPAPAPHVVVSKDAGVTWASADGPILGSIVGRIRDLDASLGNASAAALLVDVQAMEPGAISIQAGQVLLATDTAGRVWEPREFNDTDISVTTPVTTTTLSGDEPHQYLSMNPVRPNEVWLYGDGGAYLATGTSVSPVAVGPTKVLDISLDGATVIAYGSNATSGHISFDGGQSFTDFTSGFPVDSIDTAYGAPALSAVGGRGSVFYQVNFPGQNPQARDVSPLDRRPIYDVSVGITGGGDLPTIFGRTPGTIEVLYLPVLDEPIDVDKVELDLVAPPRSPGDNYLEPYQKEITLRTGQARTVPYVLNVPADTTPLDVYFMIDISSSMDNTINGVRGAMQDIVDRLAGDDKIDVRFGVGSFRAYEDPPAYERDHQIGPVGGELASALEGLRSSGGGAETQMAALLQSVTGAGDATIPKGLDMHFRPGSLRVAIEVTDEPISQGGRHPAYATVIDALLEKNVRMVGLAIQDPPLLGDHNYDNPGFGPAQGLREVATGSGAVAPADGVDCDGDGDIELDPGDPIVCMIAPSRSDEAGLMADAIVSVLRAIRDVQDLDVDVSSTVSVGADSEIVESVSPEAFLGVDMKQPTYQRFSVTVRCPRARTKTTYPLDIVVNRRGGVLADASLGVTCVPPAQEVEEEPVSLLAPFVPVAAIPPPPPRPPDPVPEPNPNPNPNPQQNPQAQTGFAAQEQRQPQLAVAHQGPPVADAAAEGVRIDEFRMTAHDEHSRIPPVGFIFAAGAITSLYAYAALARGKPRLAYARNRRRRR